MSRSSKSRTSRVSITPEKIDRVTTIANHVIPLQNTKENRVFTSSTVSVTERFYYEFPFYFYYYFRAAFFLCLFPFWISFKDQTKLTLVTYKLQSLLCAIVHLSTFLLTIFDFRLQVAQPIKDRPDKIFGMANYFCWAVYIAVFAKVVWSKKIITLLEQPLPTMTRKVIMQRL